MTGPGLVEFWDPAKGQKAGIDFFPIFRLRGGAWFWTKTPIIKIAFKKKPNTIASLPPGETVFVFGGVGPP